MADSRAVLLSLALETFPLRMRRRPVGGSAYVATLVVQPDDYVPAAFVETADGVDVLWRFEGSARILRT